jgi:hypothetical protein
MNVAKFIDAMIPGFFGILLVAMPGVFVPRSVTGESRQKKLAFCRKIGGLLLCIAILYTLIKVYE